MPLYEKKGRYIIDFPDIPTKRAAMPEKPVNIRKDNFDEVETGFTQDLAVSEAQRCLGCRRCLGCGLCWAECKPGAIAFDQPDCIETVKVDRVILTSGVEQPTRPIPGDPAGKCHNVVTDLQVERMLAGTGPTGGWIIRPYDGEIPERIAFVQTVIPAEEQLCKQMLILGINEAIIWKRRMGRARLTLISPALHILGREARDLPAGIDLVKATLTSITETNRNRDIEVAYTGKDTENASTFGLVVVLTEPLQTPSAKTVALRSGIDPSQETPA
jgi:heterodisulfide reductase subunit A-like polyferredoxin